MKSARKVAHILDLKEVCRDKRVITIGDIHGCFDELAELLNKLNYNQDTDILIFAGDLCDRGPKIRETFQFVITSPNAYVVASNHDDKLLRYIKGNPVQTKSLSRTIEQCPDLIADPKFMEYLEGLPDIIEWKEGHFISHAGVNPYLAIDQQDRQNCIRIRAVDPNTQKMDKRGINWYNLELLDSRIKQIQFGHAVHLSKIRVAPKCIALDGGCVFGGVLRAVVDGKEVIQVKAKKIYYERTTSL